jgi:hypothetical protein
MEYIIKYRETEMPLFSSTNDLIKEYAGEDALVDLTEMGVERQIEILGKILDRETTIIPEYYNEEYFHQIPNGRAMHNAYFSAINALYSLMRFDAKRGKLTQEKQQQRLLKIMLLTEEYKREMGQLFAEMYEKEAQGLKF